MKCIRGMEIALVGGDSRQIAVARALTELGATAKVFGHTGEPSMDGVTYSEDLEQTLEEVRAVILPISGMNERGLVRGRTLEHQIEVGRYLTLLPPETVLLSGSLTKTWLDFAKQHRFKIYEYGEDDRIAILNSVPTAEGAVQLAMEHLPITIHGSRVVVIGFGRVGMTVARIFKALGARVFVVARRRELLARAWEMNCETVHHGQLNTAVTETDIIINTVPAMVINRDLLKIIPRESLVIDLASSPGGTDFAAAEEFGIKAILAPGLPGKVAPKTAGAILASAIPEILEQFMVDGGGR